ncbi:MAG: FAD binding domain-containing protein [Spirochaetaceae bacterium]|jgi:CO/xanthine dehydrogenase FAD-binding subunit|nr:FAD binding domain-containing protein [Spirochaetaceae bacterium]
MYKPVSQIFYPSNLQEMFNALNRFGRADIFSGSEHRIQNHGGIAVGLPDVIIGADDLADLSTVNRTERFIEIGPMVTLQQILRLGKILPEALKQSLEILYTVPQRGILSIGGAICQPRVSNPFAAALAALGVRCELRTNAKTRWISASLLAGPGNADVFSPQEILYRVRIPLEQWDFTLCRRLDPVYGDEGGLIVFIARIQNDILSDVRIVFSGISVIRNKNRETALIGQKLPLSKKDAAAFPSLWENCFEDSGPPFLRARVLSFIENVMQRFSN